MSKPLLLLVDDDSETVQVLGHILAKEGQVRFALSGAEALRLAHETTPDLILLDAEMPGMDGFEVCKALKADPLLSRIPVVFLTSHHDAHTEITALNLGAADFVSKPPQANQVIARIRAQLRARRLAEEAVARARATPRTSSSPLRKHPSPCLLIVDDDAIAVECVLQALGTLSGQFLFAATGQDALRIAREHQPDLILLDIGMPDIDGMALCARLQAFPHLQSVPIVFLTRYADPRTETRALDAGGADFIGKPFVPSVLHARVRGLLKQREQTDAALAAERTHAQQLGNERVADIIEAATDAIVVVNADDQIVLCNPAASRLFSLSAKYLLGQSLTRILHPDDIAKLRAMAQVDQAAQASDSAPHAGLHLTLHTTESGPRSVEASSNQTGDGAERLFSVFLRDLTEREQLEKLERERLSADTAMRTKSLMLSYFAHEIGNPLNGILGFTQLMEQDAGDSLPPAQATRLKQIAKACDILRTLLRDVLDFNRLESGHFECQNEVVDLATFVHETLPGMQPLADRADITLLLEGPAEGLWVLGDRQRLSQCLLNIGSNGLKYNRTGATLRVTISASDSEVAVLFEDQGEGMDEAEIAHLFEPFNRLGRTGPGHGIGLTLTRQLVHAMHGGLDVQSQRGKGTAVTLRFPRISPPETRRSTPA
jgi:PAS domain S-box-containing protein